MVLVLLLIHSFIGSYISLNFFFYKHVFIEAVIAYTRITAVINQKETNISTKCQGHQRLGLKKRSSGQHCFQSTYLEYLELNHRKFKYNIHIIFFKLKLLFIRTGHKTQDTGHNVCKM